MGGNWIRSRGSGHHGGVTASQRGGRDTITHALPPHELRNDKGYFSYLLVLPTTGPVINGYGLHASEMQSGAGYCGQRQGSWKGGQVSTPLGLTGKLGCAWGVGGAAGQAQHSGGCRGPGTKRPGVLGPARTSWEVTKLPSLGLLICRNAERIQVLNMCNHSIIRSTFTESFLCARPYSRNSRHRARCKCQTS